jgi:rifampicin phosphotransferase
VTDPASATPVESADFPHEFADPSDVELEWEWDDMHMPFAVTPLAADYVRTLGGGFNEPYELLDHPIRMHSAVWNGYAYFAGRRGVPEDQRQAARERFYDKCRQRAEVTADYWANEAIPELKSLYARVDGVDAESTDREAIAAGWLDAWAATLRAWKIHFWAILGPYQVVDDLADIYEAAVTDAQAGEALRLIQGFSPELHDVAVQLDAVTELASHHDELAARLQGGPQATLDELASLPGGRDFVDRVRRFLDAHGHLGQAYDDLGQPSYADEPGMLLAEIGKRLERRPQSAEARRAALHAEADRLADAARARLADRPDELARFEHLLALAREIGHLTEGHNYWIDRMAQAKLRGLAFRIGGRLVRDGAFDEPEDVLYLGRDEVAEVIRSPRDVRQLVAERRAAHRHWSGVRPPKFLGTRDEGAGAPPPDRFEGNVVESTEANVLRGTGASPGIARGPARVALSNADFPRIRPGDIIVCPSSNPSWVPVFTIAGGLVTNTGGVLSHAAVVAREFALPAVVGVTDATLKISDGQTIEIDGAQGTVRLL